MTEVPSLAPLCLKAVDDLHYPITGWTRWAPCKLARMRPLSPPPALPVVLQAKDMCLRYAAVEKRLGEIDRARAVLVHGSQLCDPRTEPGYWQVGPVVATSALRPLQLLLRLPVPLIEHLAGHNARHGMIVRLFDVD